MQNQVLNEYRRGDADKRMSMYLSYRGFRDKFGCIEREDPMELDTVPQGSSTQGLLSAIRRIVKSLRQRSIFFFIGIPTGWY